MKTVINGIEYSRDHSEHVFLVPRSKLGKFRASDLPNNSSMHITEIEEFEDVNLYFSVTNGNVPGDTDNYSIFLYFSVESEDYNYGSRQISSVANAIVSISSKQFLDNPQIGAETTRDDKWRHFLTYMMSSEQAGEVVIQELADLLISTLNNRKPSIHAFLCHSSADKNIVEQFAKRLKLAGSYVWFDKWEIKVGDSIVEKINDGLDKMTHLVVFLSKSSVDKPWVKKELSSGLMRKLNDSSVKVMPIKIDSVKVPTLISDIKYADCTEDLESGFNQVINDILN
jgi:hypothetical protein